jgi:hypothetical protein
MPDVSVLRYYGLFILDLTDLPLYLHTGIFGEVCGNDQ